MRRSSRNGLADKNRPFPPVLPSQFLFSALSINDSCRSPLTVHLPWHVSISSLSVADDRWIDPIAPPTRPKWVQARMDAWLHFDKVNATAYKTVRRRS